MKGFGIHFLYMIAAVIIAKVGAKSITYYF